MTDTKTPLAGQIALVTGASRGIGRATALALAGSAALELNEAPCPVGGCRGGRLKPQVCPVCFVCPVCPVSASW